MDDLTAKAGRMIAMLLDKTRFRVFKWSNTTQANCYSLAMADFHFLASGMIRTGPVRSGGATAVFRQISLEISKACGRHVLTAYTGPVIEAIQDPASIVLPPRLSDDLTSLYGLLASSTDDLDTIIGILRR
ncbi:MAG: hypothetical protein NVS3B27_07970 [Novosphingobium sp.]